jgi:hypothetical protein
LCQKVEGQQEVLRAFTAGQLAIPHLELAKRSLRTAPDFVALRAAESRAAAAYWAAWQGVPVQFARKGMSRVPAHWRAFGSRTSALTASPRLAVNPANAILNYLYAILEAESRTALQAVGCDPGVGIQHADQRSRDSMACDVMEPVRPKVDGFLLDLLVSRVFRREEFLETREGGCRLTPSLANEFSRTAERWAECLGPAVEGVAQRLYRSATDPDRTRRWVARPRAPRDLSPEPARLPTPLTESNRSEGRSRVYARSRAETSPRMNSQLGDPVAEAGTNSYISHMPSPAPPTEREVDHRAAHLLTAVLSGVEPMTRSLFLRALVPALRVWSAEAVAQGVGLSVPYCAKIRAGRCAPSRKHWESFRRFLLSHANAGRVGG